MKKENIIFILVSTFYILNSIITKALLDIDHLVYNSLAEKLTSSQINEILNFQEKWQWVTYALIPIFIIIKTSIIASILYVGVFFFSLSKINFKQLWDAVVKSEFIFIAVGVAKIIWFYFFQTNYTLEDLQYFYPLSALNIVGYQGLEPWFIYPLQVLNLFELVYWLVLAYFIGKLAFTEKDKGKPMDLGLKIVASSYGSALLLWVVVVMFFTLNYS